MLASLTTGGVSPAESLQHLQTTASATELSLTTRVSCIFLPPTTCRACGKYSPSPLPGTEEYVYAPLSRLFRIAWKGRSALEVMILLLTSSAMPQTHVLSQFPCLSFNVCMGTQDVSRRESFPWPSLSYAWEDKALLCPQRSYRGLGRLPVPARPSQVDTCSDQRGGVAQIDLSARKNLAAFLLDAIRENKLTQAS